MPCGWKRGVGPADPDSLNYCKCVPARGDVVMGTRPGTRGTDAFLGAASTDRILILTISRGQARRR